MNECIWRGNEINTEAKGNIISVVKHGNNTVSISKNPAIFMRLWDKVVTTMLGRK